MMLFSPTKWESRQFFFRISLFPLLLFFILTLQQTSALVQSPDPRAFAEKNEPAGNGQSAATKNAPPQTPTGREPQTQNFEGSGANPDDEDGDVDEEGSGDGIEGSGQPPAETGTNQRIERPVQASSSNDDVQNVALKTTSTSPAAATPSRSTPKAAMDTLTTTTSTTTTTTPRPTTQATTPYRPKQQFTTTTTQPPPQSTRPTLATSTKKARPVPPTYVVDPTNTLEQLKPGIFAMVIGGAVVCVLLVILCVTYVLYRIRKKDEGSYTCEEPVQPHHYSYAYQKASIKEFYA